MAKYNGKCPVCGGTLSADSEAELINKIKQHGKEKHAMEMTDTQARDLIQK